MLVTNQFGGGKKVDHVDAERQKIADLIERECTTYLCRDFDGWAECVLQDPRLRRIGAMMGGSMDYVEGWKAHVKIMTEMFERHPDPAPDVAAKYERLNWSMRISQDMAWASFDQYAPKSPDPFVAVGLSHQIRILEKHDGDWKISMFAFGDTSLEYFDFPAIKVDRNLNTLWMNDRAKSELPGHPTLRSKGGRLHCFFRTDNEQLREAIDQLSQLNIMDYRPTIENPNGHATRPILLEGDDGRRGHLVWVTYRDRVFLVHFNDAASLGHRLDVAKTIFGLSTAQSQLARLVVDGLDMPTAAERLGISLNTAKTHLQRLFDKTEVRSQPALVATLLGVSSNP